MTGLSLSVGVSLFPEEGKSVCVRPIFFVIPASTPTEEALRLCRGQAPEPVRGRDLSWRGRTLGSAYRLKPHPARNHAPKCAIFTSHENHEESIAP